VLGPGLGPVERTARVGGRRDAGHCRARWRRRALTPTWKKHADVEQALTEAQARRDSDRAAEHTRYAKRWALESQVRWEALRELVEEVHRHVVRTGTDWAVAELESAEEALRQAITAARAAHEAAGLALPPELQPAPRTSVTEQR